MTADRPATEPRTRYEDVAPEGRRISDVGGESSLVRTLSDAMLAKLAKNRGKRHWQDAAPTYLIDRLRQEVEELEQAIGGYLEEGSADENDVWAEAADVANFAAMLADNATGRAEAAQGAASPAALDVDALRRDLWDSRRHETNIDGSACWCVIEPMPPIDHEEMCLRLRALLARLTEQEDAG